MTPRRWTIQDLLKVTADYLREKGIEGARSCAEILLAHQLRVDRIDLYLGFDKPLQDAEIEGYRALIRRRLKREPLQYITGRQEFWSLEFKVGEGVLIPRPESEVLVERALALAKARKGPGEPSPVILDLGTGCGTLIISLARELEGASLYATDLSGEALGYARTNAERHGSEGRIRFFQGDLFDPLKDQGLSFDMIVSNPPYVATEVMDTLMPEVRDHEPRIALDGGKGGMECLRRIILEGASYLRPDGWLLIEMDPAQTEPALRLMDQIGCYRDGRCIQDYTHRFRVVEARKA